MNDNNCPACGKALGAVAVWFPDENREYHPQCVPAPAVPAPRGGPRSTAGEPTLHDAADEYATMTDDEALRTAATWIQTSNPGNPYALALSNELVKRAANRPPSSLGEDVTGLSKPIDDEDVRNFLIHFMTGGLASQSAVDFHRHWVEAGLRDFVERRTTRSGRSSCSAEDVSAVRPPRQVRPHTPGWNPNAVCDGCGKPHAESAMNYVALCRTCTAGVKQ
jgi:hypothetical protein